MMMGCGGTDMECGGAGWCDQVTVLAMRGRRGWRRRSRRTRRSRPYSLTVSGEGDRERKKGARTRGGGMRDGARLGGIGKEVGRSVGEVGGGRHARGVTNMVYFGVVGWCEQITKLEIRKCRT